MKEYLPFLIGTALVLFQFYNNFRKEQEKARKRNPSLPPAPSNSPRPVSNQSDRDRRTSVPAPKERRAPEPDLVKERSDPARPYEPTYERDYREPSYERPKNVEKVAPVSSGKPLKVEITHLEDISDETRLNRDIHKPHKHRFGSFQQEEDEAGYEFDMRDAVIKEAILNRPQH